MIIPDDPQLRLPSFHCRGPYVSRIRQFFNFLGCLFILPVYYFITGCTSFPLTTDLMISIFVAEYNRWANERRRETLNDASPSSPSTPAEDVEKAPLTSLPSSRCSDEVTRCMAAIVGYREDPDLFYRALESYKTTDGLAFTLVGVDGDQAPDMDMVRVFQMVSEY
jgi:hyaluronan synthase